MFRHRADQESAMKPKMVEAQPYAQVHRRKHNLATPTRAVSARFVTNYMINYEGIYIHILQNTDP